MISVADLDAIVQARLEDAKVLLSNGRIDGANYVCGFAVEVALKARICRTLNWPAFPEKRHEFENLSSLKTHRLDVLLALSGQEDRIRSENFDEWSAVATWDPEVRYTRVGQVDTAEVEKMLSAAERLSGVL